MKVIKDINTLVSAALEVFPELGTAGPSKVVRKLLFFFFPHAEVSSKYM